MVLTIAVFTPSEDSQRQYAITEVHELYGCRLRLNLAVSVVWLHRLQFRLGNTPEIGYHFRHPRITDCSNVKR